ncbi:MAG: hypothetical protein ACPGN3_08540 [Opitutales bacterium]
MKWSEIIRGNAVSSLGAIGPWSPVGSLVLSPDHLPVPEPEDAACEKNPETMCKRSESAGKSVMMPCAN